MYVINMNAKKICDPNHCEMAIKAQKEGPPCHSFMKGVLSSMTISIIIDWITDPSPSRLLSFYLETAGV